jgi:hypothetical protein
MLLLPLAMLLAAPRVAMVSEGQIDPPAKYGLERLRQSLAAASESATIVAKQGGCAGATLPESLVIKRTTHHGKPALSLCGSDARGLMYAALDAADRVATSGDPFAQVHNITESPYLAERGISMYTMQRAYFESKLYDENYWKRYFDLLAHSRINTFTVIFGYENGGFMAPPYPYFFDLAAHPGVRLVGITAAQQAHNTAAFRAMIRIAHERGVDVIPAIWDHIYRGGVQGGGIAGASELAGKEAPGLVTGLTSDNLAAYTNAALRRFVEVFPEIDGLEFRMHAESGLKPSEMPAFWHEVFTMLAHFKPGLRLTLRAKELPDEIIDDALHLGLKARIETKYWMEQMGLPFHPTHINIQNQHDRRHGYADLLRYPQRYRVHWRLWSGGTTRLLLWADPEYVRRFAMSARLYDGNSVDANEMLATKMLGEPHDKPPSSILNAKYRYYDYEFERYWHFYQVWGRVNYNPDAAAEVGETEFVKRFGAAGPVLRKGLYKASSVLPRIVASSYRYEMFPTTRGWAEMMRQDDLPKFATLQGSDTEQFMNPADDARGILAGNTPTSKRTPEQTSIWFAQTADAVLGYIREAEAAGASGKEAISTMTDLRILAGLAKYYAARLPAAVSYNVYLQSGSLAAFDQAIQQEQAAIAAWAGIVKAAADVYSEDLTFGVHRVGFPRHWKEELTKLEQGLAALKAERQLAAGVAAGRAMVRLVQSPDTRPPQLRLVTPGAAQPGQDLVIAVQPEDAPDVKSMRLRYRHLTQFEDYQTVDMTFNGKGLFTAQIPGSFIIPEWGMMYFVEVIDKRGNGRNYPDLDKEAPYVIVPRQ